MAYIETRASQLELQKPEKDPSEVTTDDILDEIGRKSFHIWKIFVLTSFTWAITAPLVMIGAFIDDPSCDYSNLKNLTKDCLERKSGSLVSEFSLISERSYLKPWFTSIFMLGNIFGGSVISLFSDRYGRKIVVVIGLFLQGISCCLCLLVENYYSLLILRFFQGIFFTGSGVAVWILGYESIPSVLRPYATFSFGSTWVIGYCAVAPLAYYVKEWRWLMFDIGFPSAAFMCIFAFASESFPTKERNICIGICSVIGKLVGSSAPFIQTTADIWDPLPLVIFGSFSAVAGLITLFLPETNHKQLPDTVENMS